MDAMKHFTEGMIKENKPQFEVGDTVRVSVRIKEGDKHSPRLDKITVLRRGKVRRAKLFYLRERTGKAAKVKARI